MNVDMTGEQPAVITVAQRGDTFIVQLDDDAANGLGRLYDACIGRLYPPQPLAHTRTIPTHVFALHRSGEPTEIDWTEPRRDVTTAEIEAAERIAQPLAPAAFVSAFQG